MKLNLEQFDGHTPGPWVLERPQQRSNVFEVGAPGTGFVGYFQSRVSPVHPDLSGLEADINMIDAELITAAPALLAECKAQREEIAECESALKQVCANRDEWLCAAVKQREQIAELVGALEALVNEHFAPKYGTGEQRAANWDNARAALAKVQA